MVPLDRTGQRIIGVLIEKQFTVPETYPLSENALVAGCNQKSNRDPVLSLESFQVSGALMALHEDEVVARIEGGSRVVKYRHKLDERLAIGDQELAVIAELLLRGPQAPGALKPRVARMGFHASAAEIEDVLRHLAAQLTPLVKQMPRQPRERDHRWQHLLGDSEAGADSTSSQALSLTPSEPRPPVATAPAQPAAEQDVLRRLDEVERRLADLESRLGD